MRTYQNESFSLSVESSIHLLSHTWEGVPSSEDFYNTCLLFLKLGKRHQVKRWLIDQSRLKMINPTDLQWFIKEWLPEAIINLNNKSRVAIILASKNQFSKLSSDMILRAALNINPALESRYCLGQEEAIRWLTEDLNVPTSHNLFSKLLNRN